MNDSLNELRLLIMEVVHRLKDLDEPIVNANKKLIDSMEMRGYINHDLLMSTHTVINTMHGLKWLIGVAVERINLEQLMNSNDEKDAA